jgi:hypothetical protein
MQNAEANGRRRATPHASWKTTSEPPMCKEVVVISVQVRLG